MVALSTETAFFGLADLAFVEMLDQNAVFSFNVRFFVTVVDIV